jgi:hypothetical protein
LERLSQCRRGQKQRPTTAKRCSSGTGRPIFIDIGLPVQRTPKLYVGTLLQIGLGVPSPLDGYKAPYPPSPSSHDLFPSIVPVNSQTAPFLTALLAGPGFGRPTRQLRCHLQAPSITFLFPPDPPHTRSLVLSFDYPSARCRIGGLQLTVTTMACLNPSGRRPVYQRDSP